MTTTATSAKSQAKDPRERSGLESLLEDLIAEHEKLLETTRAHRRAVSAADSGAIGACIREQNEAVQRIAAMEARRTAIVERAGEQAGAGATLTAIASRAPGVARERLLALGEKLRGVLTTLHREHEVLRTAASALAAHMDGLMRQIGRTLSHAGTYGRPVQQGAAAAGAWHGEGHGQVVTALDMTS